MSELIVLLLTCDLLNVLDCMVLLDIMLDIPDMISSLVNSEYSLLGEAGDEPGGVNLTLWLQLLADYRVREVELFA